MLATHFKMTKPNLKYCMVIQFDPWKVDPGQIFPKSKSSSLFKPSSYLYQNVKKLSL